MKILVPRFSGFCPGVKSAEKKILQQLKQGRKIAVCGKLIHNQKYIYFLATKGVITLEKKISAPSNYIIAIRTHGLDRQKEDAISQEHQLLDLTCIKVKKLQKLIEQYSSQNYYVLICGKKSHPEVQGLISYAKKVDVLENDADFLTFKNKLKKIKDNQQIQGLFICSQTTGNTDFFQKISRQIQNELPESLTFESCDSICSITSKREEAALALQKQAAITFVLGDKESSNANKLYKRLKDQDPQCFFVQGLEELKALDLDLAKYQKAMIVSSSSTPDFIEQEVAAYLQKI